MQHDKIIGRARGSLQFRNNAMMISFLVILSFAAGPSSSLSVQGSLSTLDDDTVSIELFANKSNDDVDKLVGKLHATGRIRLTIDLGGKMISIHRNMLGVGDGIDHYRNQPTGEVGTSVKNPVGIEMTSHAKNNASLKSNVSSKKSADANAAGVVLKEIFCRTLFKVDFRKTIISETCSRNPLPVDEENKGGTSGNYGGTRLRYNTTIGNEIAPEMEMRILRHPAAMIDVGDNYTEEISSKTRSTGRAHEKNEPTASDLKENSVSRISRDEDLLAVKTDSPDPLAVLPKQNSGRGRTLQHNASATQFGDLEKKSGISKDAAVSPDEGVTESVGGDKLKEAPTNRELPASLQGDMINVSRIFSRRAFQARTPWSKDQNVSSQSDVPGIKMDGVSTMDEILEAVYRVLPAEKPAKMSSSEPEVISGVS